MFRIADVNTPDVRLCQHGKSAGGKVRKDVLIFVLRVRLLNGAKGLVSCYCFRREIRDVPSV
jgi:hypothetical protein